MSQETNTTGDNLWRQIVASCHSYYAPGSPEILRMERHFPQFVSHELINGEFIIGVRDAMQIEWFSRYHAQDISRALQEAGQPYGTPVRFVQVENAPERPQYSEPVSKPAVNVTLESPKAATENTFQTISSTLPLHENYTFANFVCGPTNMFAHAAASAVAKNPGQTAYNPLFIYGGTGLGKTHLMEAIGHYVLDNTKQANVCYVTSETFLNEFINSLADGSNGKSFRERYRKVDVLLIDDVQFIAGKKQFQEEFFNTFNYLLMFNKQVVMTSDVAPKDLLNFEERLKSRFSGGMVVEIELPSYETRLAILKMKAVNSHHIVSEDVLKFIAENIKSHVRALEGALQRVISFIDINPGTPLSLDAAHALLKDMIEEESTRREVTVKDIMQAVSKFYGVTIKEILSTERTQTLVTPRQMAMYLSRKLTTLSLPNIGTAFEKNHSTVHHGLQNMKKRLSTERELRENLEAIVNDLGCKMEDVEDDNT